jgi:hypothetical protein
VTNLSTSNTTVESQLDQCIEALEKEFDADCLAFTGGIIGGTDDIIRDALEARKSKRQKLTVILETAGGYIEVVQRIAETLRRHYQQVEFCVPNFAMSAGTVLVMSGDAIHMDYYSVLGPIDPQVQRPTAPDMMVPALGYLIQYERLIEKSRAGTLTTAEMAFLVEKFDPAELYRYEQSRELSITLLKQWLVKYKFKNWRKTRTRGRSVTNAMRTRRAAEIAKLLNKTEHWHSHGRGISMEVLRRDVRLEIEDFGSIPTLSEKIREYNRLLVDYMMRRSHRAVLHWLGHYVPLV